MFFLNLSLLEFIGVLGTLSSLVVALYLLDRVRNKHVVPTLRFFQTAEKPPEQKHRRKLQQPWSLILQLLSLLLLLLAIAQLRLGSPDRSARDHGEIDIIGWDEGVLCFVEVKTHSKPGLVPPEMAVNAAKKNHIRSVARRYVRHLRTDRPPHCRFDVVSVVLGEDGRGPTIRLHKGAFGWKAARYSTRDFQGQQGQKRWWK